MKAITRNSKQWNDFVAHQRRRIVARLKRYTSVPVAKAELMATGNLTPYRIYKTGSIVPILKGVLAMMDVGGYGLCVVCKKEIAIDRLKLVPGALACVKCDDKR